MEIQSEIKIDISNTYFHIRITAIKTSSPSSTEHKTITADVWKDGLLR